jgi:hypothetical protein
MLKMPSVGRGSSGFHRLVWICYYAWQTFSSLAPAFVVLDDLLALAVEFVVAAEGKLQVEIAVSLEGKQVAWKLVVVPLHTTVEPAVEPADAGDVVAVVHN